MVKNNFILGGLFLIFLFVPRLANATYQYSETIYVNGYDIIGMASDGSSLIMFYNDSPDKIGIFDLTGQLINSFDAIGAFSSGIAFNGSEIVFSGGGSYTDR